MFKMLLEKIEEGRLVATLKLEDYDEYDEEDDDDEEWIEEADYEEDNDELPEDELEEDSVEYEEHSERIEESLKDTLEEIDKAVPTEESKTFDSGIPSEAYLEPPPAWDTLDDESPPESDIERDELNSD
jgi:hypothetical protein